MESSTYDEDEEPEGNEAEGEDPSGSGNQSLSSHLFCSSNTSVRLNTCSLPQTNIIRP